MAPAADPKPETNNAHPYRYSIQDLIDLSHTACLPFDLSRFTYAAARAGVVPPLGKCTMSSRKSSSASQFRNSSAGTISSEEPVGFVTNDIVRPSRQPSNPPAAHKQQDEGFAKFLKKHTSPNHNRVTAGGRIVPMERPSPPVFSLPAGKLIKPPTAASLSSIDVNKRALHTSHAKATVQDRAVQCPSYQANGRDFRSPHLTMSTMDHDHSPDMTHHCFPAVPVNSPLPPSMLYDGAAGGMVNHSVRPPYHVPTAHPCFANLPVQSPWTSAFPNNGLNVLPNTFGCYDAHGAVRDEALHDMTMHVELPPPATSPLHNTLAQWQQHYFELEQQLKDMDRHRAMVNLDPLLVQQRRIIVQQRSDARDTIRQLKDTLGLGHSSDSSQESFNANFNVDAPVYIPQICAPQFQADHAKFTPSMTASTLASTKPQIQSGSRAVPIKAPPITDRNVSGRSQKSTTLVRTEATNVQVPSQPSQVQLAQGKALDPLKHAVTVGEDANKFSNTPPRGQIINANGNSPAKIVNPSRATHKPAKVVSEVPHDNQQEYIELLKAVSRTKGIITSVTLVDGRKIDVEGQGLKLISTSDSNGDNFDSSSTAVHRELTNGQVQEHDPFADYQPQSCNEPRKENVAIQPQAHKKSATDAFLAQFNAGNNDPALSKHLVTQSDCGSNSAHLGMVKSMRVGYPVASQPRSAAHTNSQMDGSGTDMTYRPVAYVEERTVPQGAIEHSLSNVQSKGASSTSLQNVHATYRPHNLDGGESNKDNTRQHPVTADKNKSPRRRQLGNGRGWLGPFWRDSNDRQASPSTSPSKNCFKN